MITLYTGAGVFRVANVRMSVMVSPIQVRAAAIADAVTCARSIVADERRKVMQAFDDIDAALSALSATPKDAPK